MSGSNRPGVMAGSPGANCAMDFIKPETRHELLTILRRFSVHHRICSCQHDRTFLLEKGEKVVMGRDFVHVDVRISQDDLGFTRNEFLGFALQSCSCMNTNEETTSVLKITAIQWEMVASQHDKFLAIAVKCRDGKMDATGDTSTILPVMRTQVDDEANEIMTGELFAGGIGGWSFAVKAMQSDERVISTAWALDQDPIACHAFKKNHDMNYIACTSEQAWGSTQADQSMNLCPTMIFQTKVENIWWLSHVTRFAAQLILLSPPCPA